MKKLKLEKSTIANLNDSSMESIEGGGTFPGCTVSLCGTQCGPQCDTSAADCTNPTDVCWTVVCN